MERGDFGGVSLKVREVKVIRQSLLFSREAATDNAIDVMRGFNGEDSSSTWRNVEETTVSFSIPPSDVSLSRTSSVSTRTTRDARSVQTRREESRVRDQRGNCYIAED